MGLNQDSAAEHDSHGCGGFVGYLHPAVCAGLAGLGGVLEGGMVTQLLRNDLELYARNYAVNKASEIYGTIVDAVLSKTGARVQDLTLIPEAEAYIERFLAAMLRNSLVEFSHAYCIELERQRDETLRQVQDLMNVSNPPRIMTDKL